MAHKPEIRGRLGQVRVMHGLGVGRGDAADVLRLKPPQIRRGANAKANFSNFTGNTRQKWRFQDVRITPRPGLFSTNAPRKM